MVVIINMKQVGSPSGESSGGPSRPTRPKNGSSAKGGWFSTKNKSYGSKTANDSSSKGNGGGVLEDVSLTEESLIKDSALTNYHQIVHTFFRSYI